MISHDVVHLRYAPISIIL